jgi:hypothetical protein
MEVVYDGRNKNLRLRDQFAFYTIPFDRIASIDVPLVAAGTIDIDPSLPPRQMIRRRPQYALDIRTPHGRLRLFRGREREKLQFVADVLKQRLPATAVNVASDNDAVIAVATNTYGATRYWLPRAGIALAAIVLAWAAWDGVPGWRSRAWPTTTGEVTHSKWEDTKDHRGDRLYTAEIKYRYHVDGVAYTADRIAFGRAEESNAVRDLLRAHPTGSTIDVFYDPQHPAHATVMRGAGWLVIVPFLSGLSALALSLPGFFRLPTPEQEALVAQYVTRSHPSPARAFDDAFTTLRWTVSPEHAERSRRIAMREVAGMMIRTTTLSLIAAVGLYYGFRHAVPARLWPVIFGVATAWPMLMFGTLLGTLMWTKGSRASYALTPDGILRPRRDRPLLHWRWFDSFDTSEADDSPLLRRMEVLLEAVEADRRSRRP